VQLDSTRIAVRERGLLDIFDLSLQVSRAHGARLFPLLALGVAPLMLVNHLLIGWMMSGEFRETIFYADEIGTIARFVWDMSVLIMIEAPLASIFATAYLGQAMFVDRPPVWQMMIDVLKMLPRVAWCQLLVRGVLPVWLLLLSLDPFGDLDPTIEVVLLGFLAIYVAALRFWRPFINEIILLERNPLASRQPNTLTVSRRSTQLHSPSAGDLFFRGLTTCLIAFLLTLAVFGTFLFISGVFLNQWRAGPLAIGIVFPLSMWLVVGYLTVVRYLSYLDLRIRQEGWEIELRVRAEAARLTSGLVR